MKSDTVDSVPMRLKSISGGRFWEPGRCVYVAGRQGSGCCIVKLKLQGGISGFEIYDLR